MILIEACAGSAGLSRYLLGLGPLVGYQGAKDGYAEAIVDAWGINGQIGEPLSVVLNDPGPWGLIWQSLVADKDRVIERVLELADREPRSLFRRLRKLGLPPDPDPELAASWLVRIAGTYGGFEVGGFKGVHVSRPKVDGYIPSRASIAKRLGRLDLRGVSASRELLQSLRPKGCWVYIDPPYEGTTGYICSLSRSDLIEAANRLARDNHVTVSESEPLEMLGVNWGCIELARKHGQLRRNARVKSEWLMVSPSPRANEV